MILFMLLSCASQEPDPCAAGLPALMGTVADTTGNTNIAASLTWTLDGGFSQLGECDTPLTNTNCVVWRAGTTDGVYTLTATASGYESAQETITVARNDVDSDFIATETFELTLVASSPP